jgi:hypothetical protein
VHGTGPDPYFRSLRENSHRWAANRWIGCWRVEVAVWVLLELAETSSTAKIVACIAQLDFVGSAADIDRHPAYWIADYGSVLSISFVMIVMGDAA